MNLLQQLSITSASGTHRIELYQGDLTAMPASMAVDVLIVSAFPNSYSTINPRALISALARRGVNVGQLAKDKEADLRETHHCWLSRPIDPAIGAPFRRLLVFEPPRRSNPAELVGDIFQALMPFVQGEPFVRSLALPLVAGGRQKATPEQMIGPLLEAASHWLALGLEVDVIRIVELEAAKAQAMAQLFADFVARRAASSAPGLPPQSAPSSLIDDLSSAVDAPRSAPGAPALPPAAPPMVQPVPPPRPIPARKRETREEAAPQAKSQDAESDAFGVDFDEALSAPEEALDDVLVMPEPQEEEAEEAPGYQYDYFISYSRKNADAAQFVYEELLRLKPEARIFLDKHELQAGVAWQIELYEALDDCQQIITLLSPDYLISKVCKEEYHIALMRHRQNDGGVLVPIYWSGAKLPTYMQLYQFHDCREADKVRLAEVCKAIAQAS